MPIDSHQLAELLDRYWPVLVAWVPRERADAENIVQTAFVKLAAEDPPPENCVAWLFTVTKRLAINELKSIKRRRSREEAFAFERNRSVSKVRHLVLQLSPSQSALLAIPQ